MKVLVVSVAIVTAACANQPPEGSLAHYKNEERKALMQDCTAHPEKYGFPNTRAENADLALINPGLAPNVHTHCQRVANAALR